ncbi:unnamed protein product [Dovyalis caffra]|uniref:TF-B3 domain-containing protein n=1 Tax=Dovyalis caffra TaxID=77055 RepID=A0AAV1S038_9ROSI|nr:unnamed protein product [Dovyalis caffra]
MSINHFSTDLQETLSWWAQQHQQQQPIIMEPNPNTSSSRPNKPPNISNPNSSWPPHLYHHYHHHYNWPNHCNPHQPSSMFPPQNPTLNFNLNEEEDEEQDHEQLQQQQDEAQQGHEQEVHQQGEALVLDKEAMFEKPLTPSDVGKLNRLVIPKQHAEKYFPLSSDSVDKGLLLSFEDESGKYWKFRYSYWNSSQSYVLTKGWSRYVKEKQLDAGDVVLFERHRMDGDRLFIGWRRRGESSSASSNSTGVMVQGSGGGVWSRGLYSSSSSSGPHHLSSSNMQHGLGANASAANVPYQPDFLHAGSVAQNQAAQLGNSKRLRLFGVNLECQLDESDEPSTPEGSSLSSLQGPGHRQFYPPSASSSDTTHGQMVELNQDTKNHADQAELTKIMTQFALELASSLACKVEKCEIHYFPSTPHQEKKGAPDTMPQWMGVRSRKSLDRPSQHDYRSNPKASDWLHIQTREIPLTSASDGVQCLVLSKWDGPQISVVIIGIQTVANQGNEGTGPG